tara:strand:+ start:65 stop:301 length:237 start_codon:yes stop_codon:yes gene_type:complete
MINYYSQANGYYTNTTNDRTDPIVESVKVKYDQRSKLGIDKYNTTLYDNPDGFYKFLNHLQEELMDATLYIEKLKKIK